MRHVLIVLPLLLGCTSTPKVDRAEVTPHRQPQQGSEGKKLPPAAYRIEPLRGGLYRFVDDRHRSVFMITDEGAVVTDPLNASAATWLAREIHTRFKVPVKYVIYSHNHSDHIYGAEAFDEPGTVFVAHELVKQDITLTGTETVAPQRVFRDELKLTLGGKTVELRYHGPNDGRGSISMLFTDQRLLFVVDWIVLGRMPWQKLWSYDIVGMINSTRAVLSLEFDTFVGGHGVVGRKQDVARYLVYLETLYAKVIKAIHEGKTLAQMQREIRLEEYLSLIHI